MIDGSGYVNDLLRNKGIKLQKSLGQNFLIDKNISKKMIRLAGINSNSCVLEIGAGIGALTAQLCSVAKSVVSVELDIRLIPVLNEMLKQYDNIKIINDDILKLDINKVINENFGNNECMVCANLPYNITTPVLSKLIDSFIFSEITVMIQREVAKRIVAAPGSPDYGAFTVYANYNAVPEILFDVPPECFLPKPKVCSSVIKIKLNEKKIPESDVEKVFFRIVRGAFRQRRKTLVNALYSEFNSELSKIDIEKIIFECDLDVKIRGEVLSLDEFVPLAYVLHKRL